MTNKNLPFTREQILEIIKDYPTPFYIYDEMGIRENARKFKKAFSILPGFNEFFAVKALPNPFIMTILKEESFGADCSSYAELLLAEKIGLEKENIMFSSNDTPAKEYKKANELGAIINLDDISHIQFLENAAGLSDLICFRYNPGPTLHGNKIIGDPKESKYGFTREQIFEGYKICLEKGIKRFGIHTMIISNELNPDFFIETAKIMFELVVEIKERLGIKIEFIDLGGGIGIPYKPEEKDFDYEKLAVGIRKVYDNILVKNELDGIKIFMECGRTITGPYGYLVTTLIHLKHTYKDYVGCDACMANLMRPAIYGAYHHITVLGKENNPTKKVYDVTGSLCENNDKFAINRLLPEVSIGDILVIHDAGAHGHAMGFNYNGQLRSAELLLRENGEVIQIRRAETNDDYLITLDFSQLEKFK